MNHYDQMKVILAEFYGHNRDFLGLEIGTNQGEMIWNLLREFPRLKMVGIDSYNHHPDNTNPRFRFINESSDDAVKNFKPEEFDFIYIDAEHTHQQVRRDILNYSPLVKKDGIIAGHDYVLQPGNVNEGVRFAVDELFDPSIVHFGEDFVWWVFRKDVSWL